MPEEKGSKFAPNSWYSTIAIATREIQGRGTISRVYAGVCRHGRDDRHVARGVTRSAVDDASRGVGGGEGRDCQTNIITSEYRPRDIGHRVVNTLVVGVANVAKVHVKSRSGHAPLPYLIVEGTDHGRHKQTGIKTISAI